MTASIIANALLAATLTTALAQSPATNKPTTPPKDFTSIEVLWPHGTPGTLGATPDDIPKLYCYPAPGTGPHTAVILLPGGGYTALVMEHEGADEARWLNQHGISAYVLQYRLSPRYSYPWPLSDGQRAVRFVRSHAADWHLNPDAIGVWGFSAGGHLAGYLATADPHGDAQLHPELPARESLLKNSAWVQDDVDHLSAHPDFAIISYGRLVLDATIPGSFGMATLLGPNAPQTLIDAVAPVRHVTKDTSPCLIYATEFDQKVDSANATLFFNALHRAGVPAELHIFEQGPHGTHMGQDQPNFPELSTFALLLENWLKLHNWLSPTSPVQP